MYCQQLVAKIVDRVFVFDDRIIGIALHGDFGVILDDAAMVPNDVLKELNEETKMGVSLFDLAHTQSGSDGHGSLSRCVILAAKKSYAAVVRALLER